MPFWFCYIADSAFQACDLLHLDGSVVQDSSRHWGVCLGQQQQERCWTILLMSWYAIPSYPTLELKLRMELTDCHWDAQWVRPRNPSEITARESQSSPPEEWKPLRWQGNTSDMLPVIGDLHWNPDTNPAFCLIVLNRSPAYLLSEWLLAGWNRPKGSWKGGILYSLRVVPVQSYAFCALQCPRHFLMADGTCACWTKLGGGGSFWFSLLFLIMV